MRNSKQHQSEIRFNIYMELAEVCRNNNIGTRRYRIDNSSQDYSYQPCWDCRIGTGPADY